MLTSKDVQTYLYQILCDSTLFSMVSGAIYRAGYRPRNSQDEDIIISFTAGSVGDIESGVVTLNIYVPDIDPFDNGLFVEDGERTTELEKFSQEWVDSLTVANSNFRFHLMQTIYTEQDKDIQQHFIVIRLGYDYYKDNI